MKYHLVKDGMNYVVNAESEEEAVAKVKAYSPVEQEAPAVEQTTGEFAAGAAMDLAESALGLGDEAGAAAMSVADFFETGEWNWDKNLKEAQSTLDQFEAENPVLSGAITAAGVAGSLLIPGATAFKVAKAGSQLQRSAVTAGLVAGEGAVYGALAGRGEEGRMQGAMIGAALGGTLGLGVSVLLRNSDEIAKMAAADKAMMDTPDAGHIAGKEGFADVAQNTAKRDVSKTSDSSTADRKVKKVLSDEEWDATGGATMGGKIVEKATGAAGDWFSDSRRWLQLNVGERAARLVEDAEWMGKAARVEWVEKVGAKLSNFDDKLNANPALATVLQNLGRDGSTWDDAFRAAGDDMAEELTVFKNMYDDLKALDIPDLLTDDWVHTAVKPVPIVKVGKDGVKVMEPRGRMGPDGLEYKVSDYHSPVKAMLEYADEITSANALAERFGIKMADIKLGKGKKARIEGVIDAIGKAAKKEGASKEVVANLKDGLASTFIASKAGGDAAGALARKVSSTAFLGSPMNAILNVSEWVTPAFQNNLANWAQQVPQMVTYALKDAVNSWSSIGKYGLPKFQHKGLTPEKMGLGDQYMGELSAVGERTFSGWVDTIGKFVYDKSFVTTSNKTGQFAQMNSAVNRGSALAKQVLAGGKGAEKAMRKFRGLDGTRGLSDAEIMKTAEALAARQLDNGYVRNFAGASLNMWQPVSSTALPKAFADNPNGRIFYSMLTYMNRQMNGAREQVGSKLVTAYKRGLNTEEGRRAAREGAWAAARYTAYYGVGAGLWERYRSSLDASRDIDMDEVMTMEGMTEAGITQLVSNFTSGLVDMRAQEYGRGRMNIVPAPVQWAGDVGSGMLSGVTGAVTGSEQDMTEFYRMLQGNVPGISAADKMNRLFNDGERLLVQPKD